MRSGIDCRAVCWNTNHRAPESRDEFWGYESADDAEAAVADAYANVARVLGTEARNIAVVENSTVAFFQAMSGLRFQAPAM